MITQEFFLEFAKINTSIRNKMFSESNADNETKTHG